MHPELPPATAAGPYGPRVRDPKAGEDLRRPVLTGGEPPRGASGASVLITLSRTDKKGGMARWRGGPRDHGSVLAGEKGGGHARPLP